MPWGMSPARHLEGEAPAHLAPEALEQELVQGPHVVFSKRANDGTNWSHYDAASACTPSARLSSRHRCTYGMYASSGSSPPISSHTFSATRSTVNASPLASVLPAMWWSAKREASVSSRRPKMRAHALTSTSLDILGFGGSGS